MRREREVHVRRLRWQRGQGLVEFALAVPVLLMLVLGVVQFGVVYSHGTALTDAVRVAGRAAALCHSRKDPQTAYSQAVSDLPGAPLLQPSPFSCPATGTTVSVSGSYPYSIEIFGVVVARGNLTSQTTQTVE